METRTQDTAGYYVWAAPGKPISVHLHLDVMDRMVAEVMRGFGAVPKRGAEVGGLLIGAIEEGEQRIVRIQDFEPVECAYKRGPSYLLTDDDGAAFERAYARRKAGGSRSGYMVGFFRSHTRDGLSLSPDDIELLDEFFPEPSDVALLIKPFATKASEAGFFFRENGAFPQESPLTFPFRRRDLTGEPPSRRPLIDRRPRERNPAGAIPIAPPAPVSSPVPSTPAMPVWGWIALLALFLVMGGLLGFQWAITMSSRAAKDSSGDFSLALSISPAGDNLTVRWNRDAPAIRNAQRGVLEIEDAGYSQPVELDAAHLQNGSIIYRNQSPAVRFRLIVYENARLSISETLDWRQ